MLKVYSAIQEWRVDEAEVLYKEAGQVMLRKWQSLPSTTGIAHIPLLQTSQNFVELQESIVIMNKMQKTKRTYSSSDTPMPDLTTHLHVWKERLPNHWEDATVWTDVLSWRLHMFDVIKSEDTIRGGSSQRNAKNNQKHKVHDRPWTLLQLCQVAQRQVRGFIFGLLGSFGSNFKNGVVGGF